MSHTQAIRPNKHSSHVKNMTVGNPYKLMLSFALPVFLSELFQQLYNTADSLIVGRVLGTDSLAAVSSSGPLIFLMVSFFTGTAMGGGVVISRYFGAGDEEKVSRSIHTLLAFGLVSGLTITAAGLMLTPTLLRLLKTDPDVLPEAIAYFRCYFLGGLSLVLYNICRSIMNALGDSRRPLYYLIISSMLNVTLDLLFLAVFRWGVWAAAFATVLSQLSSVVLCMSHLLKKGNVFTVQLSKIRFHKEMLVQIIRYGMPAGVQNSVIAVANVVVQAQINSFGKFATAAYGAHAKIEGFAFLPITSFNMASSTFVSQNLGARQYDRAKKGARFCILTAVAIAELIGVTIYLLSPHLIGLFDKTPAVIEYGVKQAHTLTLFYCLLAFSHSVAAVCRGAGKAFVPMFVMLSVWCAVRIAYILLVMHFFGEIQYVYWAYPLTWGISSVIYLLYYLCSDWVHGFEKKRS